MFDRSAVVSAPSDDCKYTRKTSNYLVDSARREKWAVCG